MKIILVHPKTYKPDANNLIYIYNKKDYEDNKDWLNYTTTTLENLTLLPDEVYVYNNRNITELLMTTPELLTNKKLQKILL